MKELFVVTFFMFQKNLLSKFIKLMFYQIEENIWVQLKFMKLINDDSSNLGSNHDLKKKDHLEIGNLK